MNQIESRSLAARLPLSAREREIAVVALKSYLEDRSPIVRTFSLQALPIWPGKTPVVVQLLHQAMRGGTAAMKARSRKLLLRPQSAEYTREIKRLGPGASPGGFMW